MTDAEKLTNLKLKIGISDTSQDSLLTLLLAESKDEILRWRFDLTGTIPTTLPSQFDRVQIEAAMLGYNLMGAEGESSHNENGVQRNYKYTSKEEFIHANVNQLAGFC